MFIITFVDVDVLFVVNLQLLSKRKSLRVFDSHSPHPISCLTAKSSFHPLLIPLFFWEGKKLSSRVGAAKGNSPTHGKFIRPSYFRVCLAWLRRKVSSASSCCSCSFFLFGSPSSVSRHRFLSLFTAFLCCFFIISCRSTIPFFRSTLAQDDRHEIFNNPQTQFSENIWLRFRSEVIPSRSETF